MKFEIRRHGIVIIPDNDHDRAYIEDTLGLKKDGEYVLLLRKNAHGLGSIAYLETAARAASPRVSSIQDEGAHEAQP